MFGKCSQVSPPNSTRLTIGLGADKAEIEDFDDADAIDQKISRLDVPVDETKLVSVLQAERNLRGILGLPIEDGCRLVPITPPTMAPFRPDWCTSLQDALTLRPELVLARDNLRQAQLNLIAA